MKLSLLGLEKEWFMAIMTEHRLKLWVLQDRHRWDHSCSIIDVKHTKMWSTEIGPAVSRLQNGGGLCIVKKKKRSAHFQRLPSTSWAFFFGMLYEKRKKKISRSAIRPCECLRGKWMAHHERRRDIASSFWCQSGRRDGLPEGLVAADSGIRPHWLST